MTDWVPVAGKLRPSSLPKLACCRCFDGAPGAGPAAERGTQIDACMRAALITGDVPQEWPGLTPEDLDAVRWGVDRVQALAGDAPVLAEEELLHVDLVREVHPAFARPNNPRPIGIMDALAPEAHTLFDFKTGQRRDYTAQMAAYALALMTRSQADFFADPIDRYTAHLIYVDLREVDTMVFTMDEAREIVRRIIDAPVVPRDCEYCTWCAHFGECPVTREAVGRVLEIAQELPNPTPAAKGAAKRVQALPPPLDAVANDEARAYDDLKAFAKASSWFDLLKQRLKGKLSSGFTSEYFMLTRPPVKRVVLPLTLARYMGELGYDRVLGLFAPVSLSKFEPMWREVFGPDKPIPDEMIREDVGSPMFKTRTIKH